jgi:hypothetical protein
MGLSSQHSNLLLVGASLFALGAPQLAHAQAAWPQRSGVRTAAPSSGAWGPHLRS